MKSSIISYTLVIAVVATGCYVLYRYFSTSAPSVSPKSAAATAPADPSKEGPAGGAASQTEGKEEDAVEKKDTTAGEAGGATADVIGSSGISGLDNTLIEEGKDEEFTLPQVFGRKGGEEFARVLREIAERDDKEAALQLLTKEGWMTEEQAKVLLEWYLSAGSEAGDVQLSPIGTLLKDDKNLSRFRLETPSGKQLIIDFLPPTSASAPWTLSDLKTAQKSEEQEVAVEESIHVVENFVNAVREGDTMKARRLITGKDVTDASIAGLCMVFIEGGYKLRDHAPIRASFEADGRAAYLVYLVAEEGASSANVGIELAQMENGTWLIDAVSLDSLLESYEESADAEGGRYFPIVKDPQGGVSLVLFFDFDDSRLTPRSLRQLKIVADLLTESKRKLDISGHTDDVGSALYNKELSLKRATAVMKALVEFGVSPGQITMKGMGKSQPRRHYSETDDEDRIDAIRAENRRAEIYLDFE